MAIHYISSTDLKNNVSEVLDRVRFKSLVTVVEKYGKPIAKIVPVLERKMVDVNKVMAKTFGSLPDFPDVTKKRVSRRKDLSL